MDFKKFATEAIAKSAYYLLAMPTIPIFLICGIAVLILDKYIIFLKKTFKQ